MSTVTLSEIEKLSKYAELKRKEKEIKALIDELNPEVLHVLQSRELDEIQTEGGKFTVSSRRSWTYSPATTALEESLDKTKKEEQQRGVATYEESHYLKFYESKPTDS